MVLIFLSKLRSFLGLYQICVIMVERRWDSFKMAVNIFRADLLALVWRLVRGSTMGIPISFFFGRWCQPLSATLKVVRYVGWGSGCSPGARNSEPGVRDLHHLGACGSFFSGNSVFSSAIIQLGFTAFTEWIGILSSDIPVVVMDLTRILCFGGGVSEFTLNVSREAAFHRPVLHL